MNRFKNILCIIEPDDTFRPALERAITLAENNQAALTVIDVVEHIPPAASASYGGLSPDILYEELIPATLQAEITNARTRRLEELLVPYRERIDVELKVLKGIPFLEIIREVLRCDYDLLIKVAESQNWLARMLGSDDMHLLRKCPCPVWLIKPNSPQTHQRILAAIDTDDADSGADIKQQNNLSCEVLKIASSLAVANFAELHIVHAWEAPGESTMRGVFMDTPDDQVNAYVEQVYQQHKVSLDNLMEVMANTEEEDAMSYLKPKVHIVKGWARKEIPLLTKQLNVDLLVMGTVARTGIPGYFIGNTAESILNQIDCSVMAIKPSGFVTPVSL